jgi:hypothetical protein
VRLQGFSAEISLGRSGGRYEASGYALRGTRAEVQPHFCRRQGNAISCVACSDGYCWKHSVNIPTLY